MDENVRASHQTIENNKDCSNEKKPKAFMSSFQEPQVIIRTKGSH